MNKKPLTFPSTYYPRGPNVNANIKNMSKCYAIKKFLLYYFQKYLFVVANMTENSLDQLIEISYRYNIKMDQFDLDIQNVDVNMAKYRSKIQYLNYYQKW